MASLQRCKQGHFYDATSSMECPLCNSSDPIEVTVQRQQNEENHPVCPLPPELLVGWLVDIASGQSYHLRGERSFVGSSDTMDVRLQGDETVLANHHASVTYDSKRLRYTLTAGPDSGAIRLNDQSMAPRSIRELAGHDILEIGRTRLVFLPLCGEKFQWKE
jgi:hypothetical protein